MTDRDQPTPRLLQAGRTDPAHRLADRLARAPAAYLEGALENPALDGEAVLLLLRNREATAPLLRRVHADPRFRRMYEVQKGLAAHPRSPRALAFRMTHLLRWPDLAGLADDVRAPSPVRRLAIRILEGRLDDLALGERKQLARTGGRSVILALRQQQDLAVLGELLRNPRLVEDDLVAIAVRGDADPTVLALLARSTEWTRRYGLRRALAHNARTPIAAVLPLLTGLLQEDLRAMARRPDQHLSVRRACLRVLRARGGLRARRPTGALPDGSFMVEEEGPESVPDAGFPCRGGEE